MSNQSDWIISNEEFSVHQYQFNCLGPHNGYINGLQAKELFMKSKLSNNILGKIWNLADYDQDGLMSVQEFSIAMHLIKKKLEGVELPLSLPKEIFISINNPFHDLHSIASVNNVPTYSDVIPKGSTDRAIFPDEKSISLSECASIRETPGAFIGNTQILPTLPNRATSSSDWTIMQSVLPRYRLQFNQQDRQKKGHLDGEEAKAVLLQSGLSNAILAKIWTLSDIDCNGILTCEEFCVAMYLVEQARAGRALPQQLPRSLIPQSMLAFAHAKSPSTTEDSLSMFDDDPSSPFKTRQFEYEIKPNNYKLEREKKRLIDMEHARLQQAIEERNMEMELLNKLKNRKEFLVGALATEEKKCQQFQVKLNQSIECVESHKADIESMRYERDKLVDTTSGLNEELEAAKAERSRCQKDKSSLQQKFSIDTSDRPLLDNITEIEKQKQVRQQSISNLQQEIITLQNNIDRQIKSAANTNSKLRDLELTALDHKLPEIRKLSNTIESKKNEVMGILEKHKNDSKLENDRTYFQNGFQDQKKTENVILHQYKALYDFTGRQSDELTFRAHDMIMVQITPKIPTAPGWLSGKLADGDFYGVFPELYARKVKPLEVGKDSPNTDQKNEEEDNAFDLTLPHGSTIKRTTDMWVEAVFPWLMDVDDFAKDQLSFNVGQMIRVLEEFSEDWWKGEIRSSTDENIEIYNVGWFPRIYVQPVDYSESENSRKDCMVESITKYSNLNFAASNDIAGAPVTLNSSSTRLSDQSDYCVALYPYESSVPGDLTMRPGDIIRVIDTSGDWWKGNIRGIRETGLFPSRYVKKITKQEIENPATLATPPDQLYTSLNQDNEHKPSETYDHFTEPDPDSSDINRVNESRLTPEALDSHPYINYGTSLNDSSEDNLPEVQSSSPLRVAIVISDFFASASDQITCIKGQRVLITDIAKPEWFKVEISVNGSLKSGWVPRYCLSWSGNNGDAEPRRLIISDPMTASGYDQCITIDRSVFLHQSSLSDHLVRGEDQLISIYPYAAQNPDELTFSKNAVIHLLSKDEPEWWRGVNVSTGLVGLFPVNYVRRPQPDSPTDKELIANSVPILPEQLDKVQQISRSIEENVKFHAILTEDEKRRQFYILELIETEKAYYDDLHEVYTVFYEPIRKANLLAPHELKNIFINLAELIPKSYNFYMALKIRQDNSGINQPVQCIGDIILSNLPNFATYVRFCSLQNKAISLLEKKKQSFPKFKDLCDQCEGHLRCKQLPITPYFLKPMQRILKYKLLVENILKYTGDSHPDRGDMEEAVAAARSLCEAVNEGIREKENSEKLEWIQDHVNCDELNDKIYFNSATNSMGHRKFIHSGSLRKAKSGKELVGFLFNDILLLTTPCYNTNGCPFVFPLDTSSHSKMQFKMYKRPILLNRITLMTGSPSSENAISVTASTSIFGDDSHNEIFTIKDAGVDHVLKALSVNDRDKWIERLVAASLQYMEIESTVREISMSIRRSAGVGRLIVTVLEAVNLKSCGDSKSNSYCEASLGNQLRRSKVVSSTFNPKWNCNMQFLIKSIERDVLCVAVYDKEFFAPNDFLGRTEITLQEIKLDREKINGPLEKRLKLIGVTSGELVLKLDLALFRIG